MANFRIENIAGLSPHSVRALIFLYIFCVLKAIFRVYRPLHGDFALIFVATNLDGRLGAFVALHTMGYGVMTSIGDTNYD
jgi:hypothetical protein